MGSQASSCVSLLLAGSGYDGNWAQFASRFARHSASPTRAALPRPDRLLLTFLGQRDARSPTQYTPRFDWSIGESSIKQELLTLGCHLPHPPHPLPPPPSPSSHYVPISINHFQGMASSVDTKRNTGLLCVFHPRGVHAFLCSISNLEQHRCFSTQNGPAWLNGNCSHQVFASERSQQRPIVSEREAMRTDV